MSPSMDAAGLISVIVPLYNQADHAAGLVERYEEALGRLDRPHELILVPNGCRDRTAEACRELGKRHPAVRVVELADGGWGRAVKAGLAQARGELICYTNAARTSPQNLVLLLVYAIANPGVVIKANRKIRDSWIRRLGSLLYNIECRVLFDLVYWDINGTPKVFPRSCSRLLELTREDDLIDAEFNLICRAQGYPMLEVPILSTLRAGGRSTTNFGSAFRMYWGVFANRGVLEQIARSSAPAEARALHRAKELEDAG